MVTNCNQWVAGSIPAGDTKLNKKDCSNAILFMCDIIFTADTGGKKWKKEVN